MFALYSRALYLFLMYSTQSGTVFLRIDWYFISALAYVLRFDCMSNIIGTTLFNHICSVHYFLHVRLASLFIGN